MTGIPFQGSRSPRFRQGLPPRQAGSKRFFPDFLPERWKFSGSQFPGGKNITQTGRDRRHATLSRRMLYFTDGR